MAVKVVSTYQLCFALMLACLYHPGDAHAQRDLKIMSYNIHHGQDANNTDRLKEMAELVTQSGADIVGLQEVDSICYRSGKIDQAKLLAELTGMHYVYVRHFAFEGGSYGLALLSKYPIANPTNHRLPIASEIPNETRALLTAEVQVSPKRVWLVGVAHFDYRDSASRIKQAKQTIEIFQHAPLPGILVGDMNAEPDSEPIAVLSEKFYDTQPANHFTYPALSPLKKIDYIFIDKKRKIRLLDASVLPVQFSDHRPVVTKFR